MRIMGMTHVRTSLFDPQSNGKLERWHTSLKSEAIRPKAPRSQEDAQGVVADYVTRYNTVRLHSAIGYLTPQDKLEGRAELIFAERDRKLEAARQARCQRRAAFLGTAPFAPALPAHLPTPAREPLP
jgi:putative transposase